MCEAYHWTLDEAKSLTMPQIIMWNHAAFVNKERSDIRWDMKRAREEKSEGKTKPDRPSPRNASSAAPDFDSMTATEIVKYVVPVEFM